MALLSEQPFMTTESLRNNVLMGQAFDANKYKISTILPNKNLLKY